MGVFDIFKKKEEFTLEDLEPKDERSKPRFEEDFKPAFSGREEFSKPSFSETDVQLILTRLELIVQKLENMDRRLQVIEKVANDSK